MGLSAQDRVVLQLELRTAKLDRQLSAAQGKLNRFNRSTSRIGKQIRGQFISMFAVVGAGQMIRSQVALLKKLDSSNRALKAITGSTLDYNRAKSMLSNSAEKFGVDLLSLTQSYVRFFAASKSSTLSTVQLDDIFNKLTKSTSILGLSADETAGVLKALEQMLSKGKVQAEELRGQLGDRLPGAFVIMAKSMGITTAELDKMLKMGGVMADKVLPNFAIEYEKAIGADQITRVETLTAAQNRLTTAWTETVAAVDSGEGKFSRAIKAMLKLATYTVKGDFTFGQKSAKEKGEDVGEELVSTQSIEQLKDLSITYFTWVRDLKKSSSELRNGRKEINQFGTDFTTLTGATQAQNKEWSELQMKLQHAEAIYLKLAEAIAKVDDETKGKGGKLPYTGVTGDPFTDLERQRTALQSLGDKYGDEAAEALRGGVVAGLQKQTDDAVNFYKQQDERENKEIDKLEERNKKKLEKQSKHTQAVADELEYLNGILETAAVDTIAAFAESIGNGDRIDEAFASMLGSIGAGMVTLGKYLIGIGIGIKAFKESLQDMNPAVAIAAGATLIALGSAFRGAASRMSGGSGGGSGGRGGGSGRGFSSEFVGQSYPSEITLVADGDSLRGVIDMGNKADSRNRAN